ncbi:MAG: TM0106 family RecB-like putative nuclease, partial [Acetobacterium sp.]|nr:TM0106 family RecB-like putative nuclease [Acetobacterium sp.]
MQKLKDSDDLSLLSGLKPKEISNYNNRGIFSVKQLSYKYRPKKILYRKRNYLPELKALAIRENKTFIRELPNIKTTETEIYLDIEGLPERNFTYLLGVVIKKGDLINTYSFWADSEKDENEMYVKLVELLKPLTEYTVYHYGSYETDALKRISKRIKQEYCDDLACIIRNSFNLLNIFTTNIYPPTYSNGLKEIAHLLDFNWSEQSASGIQSIIWRNRWELTNDEEVKRKLITYNLEDCKALLKVKEWIVGIPNKYDTGNIVNVENIKIDSTHKWQNNFLIKAFENINRFAYFDYQREKVYIKTCPRKYFRKNKRINNNPLNTLRPNIITDIRRPRRCEKCNSTKIHNYDKANRVIIDLKLS